MFKGTMKRAEHPGPAAKGPSQHQLDREVLAGGRRCRTRGACTPFWGHLAAPARIRAPLGRALQPHPHPEAGSLD